MRGRAFCQAAGATLMCLLFASGSPRGQGQSGGHAAEAAEILKADTEFAKAVADRNRDRFLSFIAEATTFNGGLPSEVHGRDAVTKDWNDFFDPMGPTLSWTPTHGEVVGSGDLGYTTDRSLFRSKGPKGEMSSAAAST